MDRHRDRERDSERDRDRDHDRDRDRDRDRYTGGSYNNPDFQQRRPSGFSDGPPSDNHRSPGNFRGGFSGGGGGGGGVRRAFDSPPHHPLAGPGGGFSGSGGGGCVGFRPAGGGPAPGDPSGCRPMGGGVGGPVSGGFGNDFQAPLPPLSGQKRGFTFPGRGGSPEHYDGRRFVKLFVGSVPRTVTEEEIRPLFEEQGNVLEVALIKDKRTGQQQGCCFIKYATSEEADRAIRALHNQYTLPGGIGPIQVRYADGERERLGNVEYKLFVGSLNKLATEKEVEEIFAPFGRIEDVYLMRDEMKQSRGCGFVKFSNKDSAMAAINALNGIYMMRGCDQPLTVRFADPKRPRAGEPRTGPAFGGPGFGPLPPPGIRPAPGPNFTGSMGGRGPQNSWQPMSPQSLGPSSNAGVHGFGNQFPPRPGSAPISSSPGDHLGQQGSHAEGCIPGAVPASSASPQNYNQSFLQAPPSNPQISPLQKPLPSPQHFPASFQLPQGPGPNSQALMRPPNQLHIGVQPPYSQAFPSMHPAQFVQQSPTSATAQQRRMSTNPQSNTTSSSVNAHMPAQTPQHLPFQQSPSPLAQMLSQQTQTLQATYQSSQHAISQLQQQVLMMQPSNQNQPSQQNYQAAKQEAKSQWAGVAPTMASSATPTAVPLPDVPFTSSAPALAAAPAPVKCNWTEHTSPDGYKYYYNSVTNESRWIKPEELTLYEQQQKFTVQQPQIQPNWQVVPTQQVTQSQPPQLQALFRQTEQFQHPSLSSIYQAPRGVSSQIVQEAAYTLQAPASSLVDPSRFQQGFEATQDWAWKTNSGGGT